MNRLFWMLLAWGSAPFAAGAADAQDWPQFRGPDGQGVADVRDLPTTWSEDSSNVIWKAPIRGLGWSSPTMQADRVWLTTADEDGRSLRVVCLNLNDGQPVLDVEVFHLDEPGQVHSKNSRASPTPILAGEWVYVHFGAFGTACLSREGKVLWRRKLEYNHVHGPGGSPLLHGDLLIVNCDGGDSAFVVALDAQTGDIRWRTDRPANADKKFAFSTPLPIRVGSSEQLVSAGAGGVSSYDPASGEEIWRVDYPGGYSNVPRPIFGLGMAFVSTGYDQPELLAIRCDGRGNVTETHVAWRGDRNAPLNPSPLLVGQELYMVSDNGVASCLDAATGEVHWRHRVPGTYSASPVFGDGKIYLLNETGAATVLEPGQKYRELAVNSLPGRTLSTPAPMNGALLLRTDTHLYRIGKESSP